MITELYVFSPGSYVVAEEWNANFRVLMNTNLLHQESIVDANATIMKKDGDYTPIFNIVNLRINSYAVPELTAQVSVDCEYYKSLDSGEQLTIKVGHINGEARVVIRTIENSVLKPIQINYDGGEENIVWVNGIAQWYLAGMKFIFLLERNNKLYVRMIATE